MIRREFRCACGWVRGYDSTLVLDHEARVEIQAHNLECEQGL